MSSDTSSLLTNIMYRNKQGENSQYGRKPLESTTRLSRNVVDSKAYSKSTWECIDTLCLPLSPCHGVRFLIPPTSIWHATGDLRFMPTPLVTSCYKTLYYLAVLAYRPFGFLLTTLIEIAVHKLPMAKDHRQLYSTLSLLLHSVFCWKIYWKC